MKSIVAIAVLSTALSAGCKSKSDKKQAEPPEGQVSAQVHSADRCDEVWQVVETKKDFEKFAKYAETFAARPDEWSETCQRLTAAELECIENVELLAEVPRACETSRAKLFRKPRPE